MMVLKGTTTRAPPQCCRGIKRSLVDTARPLGAVVLQALLGLGAAVGGDAKGNWTLYAVSWSGKLGGFHWTPQNAQSSKSPSQG